MNCNNPNATHYAGCECHEKAWRAKLDACREVLESFEKASPLWLPTICDAEHQSEAEALHHLRDRLLAVLKLTESNTMKTEPEYPGAPQDQAELDRREAEQREATIAHNEDSLHDEDEEESPESAAERREAYGDWLRDKMRDDAMEREMESAAERSEA